MLTSCSTQHFLSFSSLTTLLLRNRVLKWVMSPHTLYIKLDTRADAQLSIRVHWPSTARRDVLFGSRYGRSPSPTARLPNRSPSPL
jgi:hypothetical protein